MMFNRIYLAALLVVILCNSCLKSDFEPLYDYQKANLANTNAVPKAYQSYLEGVYVLKEGSDKIGTKLVCKWISGKLCFFSEKDAIYVNMDAGFNLKDSTLRFSGFWRSPMFVEQGEVQFQIAKNEGVNNINKGKSGGIIMRGTVLNSSNQSESIVLEFNRAFSSKVKERNLAIVAHRSGGRNADNLPFAENSINLVKYAELFGSTGIEIDIRLTSDKVPILYHDPDINTRLTQKSPIAGDIEQFSFNFLRTYLKLVDGQNIPTLDEILTTAIDSTQLKYVWLDCKGGKNFFDAVVPVVKNAIAKAKSKNRDIVFLFGIPADDVYDDFVKYTDYKNLPSLCELSLEKAKAINAKVFAPRWTLGVLSNDTKDAHANGIKIITWTLDSPSAQSSFIAQSQYDGILTNYPSMLTYQFYIQE